MESLRMAWQNAYYRTVTVYISVLVTLIFLLQLYRFFIAAPAAEITCAGRISAMSLVPVVGVFFSG